MTFQPGIIFHFGAIFYSVSETFIIFFGDQCHAIFVLSLLVGFADAKTKFHVAKRENCGSMIIIFFQLIHKQLYVSLSGLNEDKKIIFKKFNTVPLILLVVVKET